ncbi:hypothetical protein HN011_003241 [Eciton burchellii]|nr:hypothetical protein HN011_003241 [Eciton burchellii]
MIPVCDTLKILHLPPHLSDDRRNDLLQKYGAIKTKTVRMSNKYTITFAKFLTQQLATEALLRLHQLNIRGQYLSVEYAKKTMSTEFSEQNNEQETRSNDTHIETINKSQIQSFLRKLDSWTMNHEFSQPPPPNIKYKYTVPTKSTLTRIAIQLLTKPAFYTQVLHLMNKMNLPPPFEELDEEFPMLKEVYDMEKYKDIFGTLYQHTNEETEEEDESELESDTEDNTILPEIIPTKRKRLQTTKRMKIPKFVKPIKNITSAVSTQKIKPEDIFESIQRGETKNLKIELKTLDKPLDVTIANQDNDVMVDSGFGLIYPTNKNPKDKKNNEENVETPKNKFITSEELATNRISANDQRVLPVFKNYHPGKPSNRLYIKNLTKQVEMKDLDYIYQRFVITGLKDVESEYNLRLMQEGRMKGQAFVTLQNIMQAQMALEETNGYILKDKPMVVQFAKIIKN